MPVKINNGYIYLDAEICERYFPSVETVALLKTSEVELLVMPLKNQAAGGLLLKRKNSRGDRVIAAMDFLRNLEIEDYSNILCDCRWDSEAQGLVLVLSR